MWGEEKAARVVRTLTSIISGVLLADLILIVVTGGLSFLTPSTTPSGPAFALREFLLASAMIARLRLLSSPERQLSGGRLMIVLALFPSLFHLHFVGRRITGDALYYYVFTRSMVRDADVDFTNEYEHYGLLQRGDIAVPTDTGHRRTPYPVGPGLLWAPFFLAADVLAAGLGQVGLEFNPSGYGRLHLNSVALGSFAYGFAALFLIQAFLRLHFGDRLAGGAVVLLWSASFFPWYIMENPLTSHPASVFLIASFFLLRQRGALASSAGAMVLGLTLGLGMSVRWQNGVFLLLPAIDLLGSWIHGQALLGVARRAALLATGVILGALPQMLAWKAIFGVYLLSAPPQGADYVRLDRPYLLNTLFSSRHGLLSWTPIFWLCLVGLILLTRRNPRRFGLLWAPVLIVTYVNACSGDWWGGGAYSGRRFDSLLPVAALGLAAFLQTALRFIRRRPSSVLAALVLAGATWNLTQVRAFQQGVVKTESPMTFASRAFASAQALSHDVGFPTTWPASWVFAARYDASPGAFDLAAGKYLFFRQNHLDGEADIGQDGDEALILDGLSGPRWDGPVSYREMRAVARLIVSLDLPEALVITLEGRSTEAPATVDVLVNGKEAGSVGMGTRWGTAQVEAPQGLWARGPNVITLRSPAAVHLDRATFARMDR